MKRNSIVLYLMSLVLALSVLSACQQDDIVINELKEGDGRDLDFVGPLANINFSVYDMIEDLEEDLWFGEDSLVYYLHREPVTLNWEHLVTLSDFDESWTYTFPFASSALKSSAESEPDFSTSIVLSHQDDVRYDRIILQSGSLIVDAELFGVSSYDIRVEIPELTKNGEVFAHTFSSVQSSPVEQILEDYLLTCTSDASIPFNSRLTLNVYVEDIGELSVPPSLSLDFKLTSLKYREAYGYMGQQEANRLDAEMDFDFFDEIEWNDNIKLGDFELDVEVFNSIGVPFYVETSNIRFYQEADGEGGAEPVLLIIDGEDGLVVDYLPAAEIQGPGLPLKPGEYPFQVTKDNSNALDIGNSSPRRMLVDLYSRSNPPNPNGGELEQNFIFSDEELRIDLVLKVPFHFWADSYARMDTVEFDFLDIIDGSEDDVDHINLVDFYFDFKNELPLDVQVTAWVVDAEGEKVDDLLAANTEFVKAGDRGAPAASSFQVGLTAAQISLFKQRAVKEIVLAYELSTGNGEGAVKIYGDSRFSAKVSVEASGSIPQ